MENAPQQHQEEEMQQDVEAVFFFFFLGQQLSPLLALRNEKAARENVRYSKFSKCVRSDFCLRDRWRC